MDFLTIFGQPPAVTADAPGRVNLIGEHTDYNGGFVLPTAIPQRTQVELVARPDDQVRVASINQGGEPLSFALGQEKPGRGWLDYVQGVTKLLREAGHGFPGFEARVSSQVPVGSGLSSSAALDVSLLRGLRRLFGLNLGDLDIARLGQRVENEFVGAMVGIMDPMASSLAEEHVALFLDARSLEYERIPLPRGVDLIVLNSGIAHDHAAGDYNTRRAECARACALLGVEQLRELSLIDLRRIDELPEPLNRRARHVVTENARVLVAVEALRAGDLGSLGTFVYESHASQREDYQVSIPAIDLIVDLARREHDVYGARLTGGGFGGSVVMLARAGTGRRAAETIAHQYAKETGNQPTVLVPACPS